MKIDYQKLMQYIVKSCPWHLSELHGITHWQRVERNAMYIADSNGALLHIVRLFAMFHDCKRENDHSDPEHGPRAADFIISINDKLLKLNKKELELLAYACRYHTHKTTSTEPTIACCWDADRLDIARAGITPALQFFSSDPAIDIVKNNRWQKLENYKFNSVIIK